jgi:hypothetical protein
MGIFINRMELSGKGTDAVIGVLQGFVSGGCSEGKTF